jgi:phage shock protein PspC (stress-responsive transcriptional regulator)
MHIPVKRSKNNRIIGGVIAGFCEKYDWNPTIARILYIILTPTSWFAGIPIYLILWLLMEKPDYTE